MTPAQSEWAQFAAALAVFLASHSVPARPALRRMLRERLGGRGAEDVDTHAAGAFWADGAA